MKLKYFLVLVLLFATVGIVYSVHSQLTPTPLRSFIVTSVMGGPSENYLRAVTFARAVRADGSWVEIWERNINGRIRYERDIHDYEKGTYTIVEDVSQSVVKSSIPQKEYRHRLSAAASCEGFPDGEILGQAINYVEEKKTITIEDPKGNATALIKTWVAPDLGCFVLKKETTWTRNSDGVLLTDTIVTPIAISFEPVDKFFEVPTTYTERTQQETVDLLKQILGTK